MIKREHYLEQIRGFYDSDLIKIITGIRRCGKSIILEQILNEIKEKTDNIIYLNFEDEKTIDSIPDCKELLNYVDKTRKKENVIYLMKYMKLKIGKKPLKL